MAQFSVSLLKVLQSGNGTAVEKKSRSAEGFDALLDAAAQPLRDPSADPAKKELLIGSVIQPAIFYAPDKTAKLKDITLSSREAKEQVLPSSDDVPEIQPRDDRPRQLKPARDDSSNDEVSIPDAAATRTSAPDKIQKPDDMAAAVATTEKEISPQPASDASSETDATPVEPDAAPSLLAQIQQLIAGFQKQLNAMMQEGNPSGVFDLVRNFFAQLQALLNPAQTVSPVVVADAKTNNLSASAPLLQPQIVAAVSVAGENQSLTPLIADTASAPAVSPAPSTSLASLISSLTAALQQAGDLTASTESTKSSLPQPIRDLLVSADDLLQRQDVSGQQQVLQAAQKLLQQLAQAQSLPVVPAEGKLENLSLSSALPAAAVSVSSVISEPVKNTLSASGQPQGAIQPMTTVAPASIQTSADTGGGDSGEFKQSLPQQSIAANGLSAGDTQAKNAASHFNRLLSPQTPLPVVEQVVFNIKTAINDGSSKIHIQLDPAHLGKLEIKLQVSADGKTSVVVIADNKDTLSLLQKDSAGLERALSDAGLKTDSGSLSFNLRQGQQERDPEYAQASNGYLKTLPEEEELPPVSVIARSYVVNLAEGLDIKI